MRGKRKGQRENIWASSREQEPQTKGTSERGGPTRGRSRAKMQKWALGSSYLPGGEAGGAHEVAARLDLHVLVVLGAVLTQLEGGAHLAVELVLLL